MNKNEKYKPSIVDVNSFGNEQFNIHKKETSNQRGAEYLSKLKNLLPSVFDEFKHDDLERYLNMYYRAFIFIQQCLNTKYPNNILRIFRFRVAEVLGKKRSASIEIEDTLAKQDDAKE